MENVTTANVTPGIQAAQAVNRGPGTNEHNLPQGVANDRLNTSVTAFLNPADNRPAVRGLILRRKKNKETGEFDGDITGVVLAKKKDFIAHMKDIAQKPKEQGGLGYDKEMTTKDAEARFEKYRVATIAEFTRQQAQRMLAGEIMIDGAKVKGDEAVAFTIVKKSAQKRDNRTVFIEKAALANNVPEEAMKKFIEEYRAKHPTTEADAQPAIDVAALEAPAAPAANAETPAPAEGNAPQHVAAGQ